tara:strand:- start:4147 stop:6078 length:1932 start_codon:yes stop_codon:yes gene_type:complete
MSVYNRKMFRKGGVTKSTGIMASGPEIIKAQNGVFMGPGNPTQPNLQIGAGAKRIPSAGNQIFVNPPIQTRAGGSGTYTAPKPGDPNYIPTNSSSILERLFPTTVGLYNLSTDAKQKIQDNIETIEAGLKNRKARDSKTKISPMSQAGIAGATGPEVGVDAIGDVGEFNFFEEQENSPGTFNDTVASLKLFKRDMKPKIEDYKKTYSKLPETLLNEAKELFSPKKFTDFLKDKLKKVLEVKKSQEDEAAFLDASGEKQGAVDRKGREILYEEERQSQIEQGFLPSDQKPGEGEIVIIDGKEKLKTKSLDGKEVITDLTEKKKKEVSVSENLKNVGDKEYDKKQLATTEEMGKGNKLNQATATLDSNSEKSAKDGLNNTSALQKTFRDQLSLLGDDKTKSHIGQILGIETFDKMSLGERTTAYKSILRATLGEDKDIKDDASFNLIMTGLLIASGDSPDAITNIARGFANGLKMYADNLGEKRKEKREIALAATKLAITADESAKERIFKADQNRLDRVSKEFIAMAKGKGTLASLRKDIYKKLISNPENYLGMRDKLIYAKKSESEKPAYLNQIATNLANTFYSGGQNTQIPYYETLSGAEKNKALQEMSILNNKAIDDGQSSYSFNNQTFAVTDKKFNFGSK